MRAKLTFAIAALTLLFFVQGLSALFTVLFAIVYDAVFPQPGLTAALLVVLPVAALFTPALPFSLWLERPRALALGVAGAAAGRVLLCLPALMTQYLGSALTVAAGALFLAKAVGYLNRRNIAGALALALTLDGLLRIAGGGYSLSLRYGWIPVQLILSLAAIGAVVLWLRDPRPEADGEGEYTLERRAGGLRLRGALALAVLLFFQLNVLSRPEVAAHVTGTSYWVAGVAIVAGGGLGVLLLLAIHGPIARHRPAALGLAAMATVATALGTGSPLGGLGGLGGLVILLLGHVAALLLLGRALVPAHGRRRGWTLAVGLGVLLVLNVLYALTFFYAFTLPAMQGAARPIVITAGALLALFLLFIPRPARASAPLRRPVLALPALAVLALAAWLFGREAPEPDEALRGDGTLRVATYNVHYGFDEAWRYDPERIARTIAASGADVVALQEVPAGILALHGTDLGRWLGHRLGMRALHAPAINGLLGDAILTRVPYATFDFALLPPAESDTKTVARVELLAGDVDTVTVLATHLGLEEPEQIAQIAGVLAALPAGAPAVLLGDLNATEESAVARALRAAGFRDAFESAGGTGSPTAPAGRPTVRIDWIWLRGHTALDAEVSSGAGSDHRLVAATIRTSADRAPQSPGGMR